MENADGNISGKNNNSTQNHGERRISHRLHLPQSTVNKLITQNRSLNSINNIAPRRKKKFSEEQIKTILSWVDAKSTTTLRELKSKATEYFNIETSEKTIERYLKEFNYALLPRTSKCKNKTRKRLLWTRIPDTTAVYKNQAAVFEENIDVEPEFQEIDNIDEEQEFEEDEEEEELYDDADSIIIHDNGIDNENLNGNGDEIHALQLQREQLQINLLEQHRVNQMELHALKLQNERDLHEVKIKHEIESHRQRLRYAQEEHKAKMQDFIKKN